MHLMFPVIFAIDLLALFCLMFGDLVLTLSLALALLPASLSFPHAQRLPHNELQSFGIPRYAHRLSNLPKGRQSENHSDRSRQAYFPFPNQTLLKKIVNGPPKITRDNWILPETDFYRTWLKASQNTVFCGIGIVQGTKRMQRAPFSRSKWSLSRLLDCFLLDQWSSCNITDPHAISELQKLKTWMYSPECRNASLAWSPTEEVPDYDVEMNPKIFHQGDTGCGTCEIGTVEVEMLYWPDP